MIFSFALRMQERSSETIDRTIRRSTIDGKNAYVRSQTRSRVIASPAAAVAPAWSVGDARARRLARSARALGQFRKLVGIERRCLLGSFTCGQLLFREDERTLKDHS